MMLSPQIHTTTFARYSSLPRAPGNGNWLYHERQSYCLYQPCYRLSEMFIADNDEVLGGTSRIASPCSSYC